MSSLGIRKSILSISSPGTALYPSSPQKSVELTRNCNDFAANLKREHPDKFGFWAGLPLPLIKESLQEAETALKDGADGIGLLTNYQGHYLGDPIFDPILELLDQKGAIIFIHPTSPCTCHTTAASTSTTPTPATCTAATPLAPPFPNPMFEFFFDTARAITNLLLRHALARFPRLRFVVPHAGGGFPALLSRVTRFSGLVPEAFPAGSGVAALSEEDARALLRAPRFHFDLAGVVFPGQLAGMLAATGLGADVLLYGSDFPFTQAGGVRELAAEMDEGLERLVGAERVEDVYVNNAARLLESAWSTEDGHKG